jgi:hypothetical protein
MTNSAVAMILRAEQVAMFATGVVVWLANGGPPLLLIPAWLAVDLSIVGYLAGPRIGALTYNVAHNLVGPLALVGLGWWTDIGWLILVGAALLTHVGLDRTLGYGLKLPSDFRDTHLGRIGRTKPIR